MLASTGFGGTLLSQGSIMQGAVVVGAPFVPPIQSQQAGAGGGTFRGGKRQRLSGTTVHAQTGIVLRLSISASGVACGDPDEDEVGLVLALLGA